MHVTQIVEISNPSGVLIHDSEIKDKSNESPPCNHLDDMMDVHHEQKRRFVRSFLA